MRDQGAPLFAGPITIEGTRAGPGLHARTRLSDSAICADVISPAARYSIGRRSGVVQTPGTG